MNQLSNGGKDFIIMNIISNERIALKLLVLIFLLKLSKNLKPLCSIRIKNKPINPIIIGKTKLILLGKNPVRFILTKEFRKTSNILMKNKNVPMYKNVFILDISGFKRLILAIIIFPELQFFYCNSS